MSETISDGFNRATCLHPDREGYVSKVDKFHLQ